MDEQSEQLQLPEGKEEILSELYSAVLCTAILPSHKHVHT